MCMCMCSGGSVNISLEEDQRGDEWMDAVEDNVQLVGVGEEDANTDKGVRWRHLNGYGRPWREQRSGAEDIKTFSGYNV